jgi:hypothetical protein
MEPPVEPDLFLADLIEAHRKVSFFKAIKTYDDQHESKGCAFIIYEDGKETESDIWQFEYSETDTTGRLGAVKSKLNGGKS